MRFACVQQATQKLDGRGLVLRGQRIELGPYALALQADALFHMLYAVVLSFVLGVHTLKSRIHGVIGVTG